MGGKVDQPQILHFLLFVNREAAKIFFYSVVGPLSPLPPPTSLVVAGTFLKF